MNKRIIQPADSKAELRRLLNYLLLFIFDTPSLLYPLPCRRAQRSSSVHHNPERHRTPGHSSKAKEEEAKGEFLRDS